MLVNFGHFVQFWVSGIFGMFSNFRIIIPGGLYKKLTWRGASVFDFDIFNFIRFSVKTGFDSYVSEFSKIAQKRHFSFLL